MSVEDINEKVSKLLRGSTGLSDEDLEDLWDWEFIEVKELK